MFDNMFLLKKNFSLLSNTSLKQLHTSNILQNAIIIDGKKIANKIQNELKITVDNWINDNKKRPKLVAIKVGNNPASKIYVDKKIKAANFIDENSSQQDIINEIDNLNKDKTVDGILVQLPLIKHMNEQEVCQAIIPSKDVDGFHLENLGNLALNRNGIIPATALAVKELIIRNNIETFGKNAVVVGRSKHVGLPIALLLHGDSKDRTGALDMTTTICHRHTPHTELEKFTKLADLVVVAAGIPGLITKEMIKPGACIIDVGITRIKMDNKYKIVGDVDFENVKSIAGHITPVPGGVGPMTVAMLMKNTILAANKNYENSKLSDHNNK
ncbi:bifunctional methylenetetrahydrofolate dehydrogenase/cyclohydrolase, mitochondrial isoform X2 [Apis florea]|uniref:bifunctional methylenetetrahydrofolate dehydrogenase/cyclohydrolase, mitochondrial isoform X2 n=1 Tax=Apis florea TaxID=7463 RepID=UPI0012FE9B05|nr:bifunctional methylenetetrahydrofolate dehydrogenase/cyclohydrolase, mitochondrial isoform X2 [Apis florea]